MKKLLYLLLLLPLGLLASCDSDDDLPDVDITVTFDNVVEGEDAIYIVKGDSLKIQSVTCKGNDNKQAMVNEVTYVLDGFPLGTSVIAPYGAAIATDNFSAGKFLLGMRMNVLQVDKTLAFGVISFGFKVVESAADLPDGKEPGTLTRTVRMSAKK